MTSQSPVRPTSRYRQVGSTLLEALLILALLTGGMVAITRMHTAVSHSTEDARLRAAAAVLVQARLNALRAASDPFLAEPADETHAFDTATIVVTSTTLPAADRQTATVVAQARWTDRAGPQSLKLATLIGRQLFAEQARLFMPVGHGDAMSLPPPNSPGAAGHP